MCLLAPSRQRSVCVWRLYCRHRLVPSPALICRSAHSPALSELPICFVKLHRRPEATVAVWQWELRDVLSA